MITTDFEKYPASIQSLLDSAEKHHSKATKPRKKHLKIMNKSSSKVYSKRKHFADNNHPYEIVIGAEFDEDL